MSIATASNRETQIFNTQMTALLNKAGDIAKDLKHTGITAADLLAVFDSHWSLFCNHCKTLTDCGYDRSKIASLELRELDAITDHGYYQIGRYMLSESLVEALSLAVKIAKRGIGGNATTLVGLTPPLFLACLATAKTKARTMMGYCHRDMPASILASLSSWLLHSRDRALLQFYVMNGHLPIEQAGSRVVRGFAGASTTVAGFLDDPSVTAGSQPPATVSNPSTTAESEEAEAGDVDRVVSDDFDEIYALATSVAELTERVVAVETVVKQTHSTLESLVGDIRNTTQFVKELVAIFNEACKSTPVPTEPVVGAEEPLAMEGTA